MITITMSAALPGRPADRIARDGDTIIVGIPGDATAYDLGGVAEGDRATLTDGHIVGPVTRTGGEIVATVRCGYVATGRVVTAPAPPTIEPGSALTPTRTVTPDEIVTAADIAAQALADHAARAKAECRRRILAVASEATQANLTQKGTLFLLRVSRGETEEDARAAVGLEEGDTLTAEAFDAWKDAMRAEWPLIGADLARDPRDDAEWPAVPAGVADLAGRF